jgi:hypothetical protein
MFLRSGANLSQVPRDTSHIPGVNGTGTLLSAFHRLAPCILPMSLEVGRGCYVDSHSTGRIAEAQRDYAN